MGKVKENSKKDKKPFKNNKNTKQGSKPPSKSSFKSRDSTDGKSPSADRKAAKFKSKALANKAKSNGSTDSKKPYKKNDYKNVVKSLAEAMNKGSVAPSSTKVKSYKRKADNKLKPEVVGADKSANIKKQRQSIKPNFDLIEKLKADWNKARDSRTPDDVRSVILATMVSAVQGRIVEITLRHDASRVIQYLLQFGNDAQRHKVLGELVTKAVEICKTPYGHFTILKAVSYCTDGGDKKKLAGCLAGHFVAVGCNAIGARTVESVMQILPPKLTRTLKAEFYGRKFITLLADAPSNLHSLIEQMPQKAIPILDHMKDLVGRFVDKGLLEFTFVHIILWEYAQEIIDKPVFMADLVNQLLDSAPKLMSTKPGAQVACIVATYSDAKGRKRLIKSLKGKVLESLLHSSAHLSIMRLVDVTDDTVNVQKSLLDEIKSTEPVVKYAANGDIIGTPYPPLVSIAKHYFGKKFLLRLLNPSKRHLEPAEEILFSSEVASSKKSFDGRRKEHLTYLRQSIITVCCKYAEDLVRCPSGHKVIAETVCAFYPESLLNVLVQVLTRQQVCFEEDSTEYATNFVEDTFEEEEEEEEEEMEVAEEVEYNENDNEEEEEEVDDQGEEFELEGDEELELEDDEENDGGAEVSGEAASEAEMEKSGEESPEVCDIEEDPNVYNLLKTVLKLEAAFEANDSSVDKSMWSESECRFSSELLKGLLEGGLIGTWIKKNRSCFVLGDMLKLESCRAELSEALNEFREDIETSASAHKGGKFLLEVLQSSA